MRAPFASLPALPLAAGIAAGIASHAAAMPAAVVVGACVAAMALMAFRHHYAAFALYAFAAGWLAAMLSQPAGAPSAAFDGIGRRWHAEVISSSAGQRGQSMIVRIDSADGLGAFVPFRAMVAVPDASERRPEGTLLVVRTAMQPVAGFVDFPHQSDFSDYYRQHGIAARAYAAPDSIVTAGRRRSVAAWCADRRADIEDLFVGGGLDDRAFGIVSALVLGDRDSLDESVTENFRAVGAAHALALSGFHVGVIVILVSVALFPLRLWPRARKARLASAVAAVWGYALLTGLGPSVVRAAVMLTTYSLARMLGRRASALNALCVAVAVILAVSPSSLYSQGFRLSVAAVLGILAFGGINRVPRRRRLLRAAVDTVVLPVSAMLGVGVLSVWYFGRLPLLFVLSNLLVTLLMPLLMAGGIVVAACAACHIPCGAVSATVNALCGLADSATRALASLPAADSGPVCLTPLGAVACTACIVALWVYLRFDNSRLRIAAAIVAPVALVTAACSSEPLPRHEIYVSDAGGHTAIVMRSADTMAAIVAADTAAGTRRRIEREWQAFAFSRRARSINAVGYDFAFGPFERRADILTVGTGRIHIACRRLDDTVGAVTHSLITTRYRGRPDTYLGAVRPDTVVLARGLGAARTRRWLEACRRRGIPVIDMHTRPWHPVVGP
ncbi:MAG: ComEC/Rec2 family competence protein [Bacteroidales bacterium]|nr:ComEC/Rec2 family competence protein [Bacteroidales bacterium]